MKFDGKAERIAAALRHRIDRNEFRPGALLPTTMELAAEYGVAKSTVTRALAELTGENRIVTRRGCGCRVLPPQTGMIDHRAREIGFYLPRMLFDYNQRSSSGDVWSEIISGAAAVAARSGYRLAFIPTLRKSSCDDLRESGCRHVLIYGGNAEFFEEFITSTLPRELNYVLLNRPMPLRQLNVVDEFGEASGVALCRELGNRGFRRLAVLGTNREAFEFTRIFPAHARYLAEAHLPRVPLVCRVPEEASDTEYDAAIRMLWSAAEKPDALLVFRARFFDGTMRALQRAGIRVPGDLPVLQLESESYSDVWHWQNRPVSGYALVGKREFGAYAARLLLQQIRHPDRGPTQAELPLFPVFGATADLPPEASRIEVCDPVTLAYRPEAVLPPPEPMPFLKKEAGVWSSV